MMRKALKAFVVGVAVSAAALTGIFLLAASAEAKGRKPNYIYECRTGWWAVRDGHRFSRPSDGMWRPSWSTRCFKVRLISKSY